MKKAGAGAGTIVAFISWYQRYFSPLKGRTCRFYPTCSQYAIDAVETYGTLKGLGLSLRRLLRCHPFHPGGHDPVPDRETLRSTS